MACCARAKQQDRSSSSRDPKRCPFERSHNCGMGVQVRASWWRRWLSHLAPRDRSELVVLLGAVGILVLLLAFALLAAEVFEGDTQAFDNRVLTSLRRVDNRSIPI